MLSWAKCQSGGKIQLSKMEEGVSKGAQKRPIFPARTRDLEKKECNILPAPKRKNCQAPRTLLFILRQKTISECTFLDFSLSLSLSFAALKIAAKR